MTLTDRLIAQTRSAGIKAGSQVRLQQELQRFNFHYVPTEGCWVLSGYTFRVYIDGPNWVVFEEKDVVFNGAGDAELKEVLEDICG